MIEIFKTNQFFATLLLIPYTFLIRIGSLINPTVYETKEYDTPFAKYFFDHLITSAIGQSILASILVFLIANFINRLIIQNRMSKFLTLLPGLFFILITAGMPSGLILSPAMLSSFFITIGIINLYKTYKNKDSSVHIFNTSFYISIAGLFYPASLFLFLFGIISLLNLRSFKINEFIIYSSGFFVPLFLVGTYYYMYGNLDYLDQYFQFDRGILGVFSNFDVKSIINLISISTVIVYALYKYNRYTMKNTIQVQKKIDIIYWFMMFCMLMMFFSNGITYNHFFILAIPFAFFIGLAFEKIKSKFYSEMLHIVIIIGALFFQFQNIF